MEQCVPGLVRLLKAQVHSSTHSEEFDVLGVCDPFLQVKLIQLLQQLGTGNRKASEQMNDILAQIAIGSRSMPGSAAASPPAASGRRAIPGSDVYADRNPVNAVLYAAVMAIMSIEAEGGLRVLAINILGRFLVNRDNNIRYVALNTLCQVVHRDADAIQRHRNTVVDCLKDVDISIRRRALDLIYALVTPTNVSALLKELLNYLGLTSGDDEFKADLTRKICAVAERFTPSPRWQLDALVAVLHKAGSYTEEAVFGDLVSLVSGAPPIKKTLSLMTDDSSSSASSSPSSSSPSSSSSGEQTTDILSLFSDSSSRDQDLSPEIPEKDRLQAYAVHLLAARVTRKVRTKHPQMLQAVIWAIGELGHLLTGLESTALANEVCSIISPLPPPAIPFFSASFRFSCPAFMICLSFFVALVSSFVFLIHTSIPPSIPSFIHPSIH